MEPKKIPSESTQQKPLQNQKQSYPEMFAGQMQNPSVDWKEHSSEVFSSKQTQAEKSLRL